MNTIVRPRWVTWEEAAVMHCQRHGLGAVATAAFLSRLWAELNRRMMDAFDRTGDRHG